MQPESIAILRQLLQKCRVRNAAFVLYRLPQQMHCRLIIGTAEIWEQHRREAYPEEGFVMAAFQASTTCPNVFVRATTSLSQADEAAYLADIIVPECSACPPSFLNNEDLPAAAAEDFEQLVNDFQAAFAQGTAQKVVASRIKKVAKPDTFDEIDFFACICSQYPTAFVYCAYTPLTGTWIGASPETLVHIQEKTLETMALAGTQKWDGSTALNDIQWGDKEREEQALVGDFIEDIFRETHCVFEKKSLQTSRAGTLLHLKTKYCTTLPAALNHWELIEKLHPTPAVAGLPQSAALQLIRRHEKHERMYYCGYIGEVKKNEAHLFVNLRCMRVLDQELAIFVGAGITAGSDAQAEWRETEWKADTLLKYV